MEDLFSTSYLLAMPNGNSFLHRLEVEMALKEQCESKLKTVQRTIESSLDNAKCISPIMLTEAENRSSIFLLQPSQTCQISAFSDDYMATEQVDLSGVLDRFSTLIIHDGEDGDGYIDESDLSVYKMNSNENAKNKECLGHYGKLNFVKKKEIVTQPEAASESSMRSSPKHYHKETDEWLAEQHISSDGSIVLISERTRLRVMSSILRSTATNYAHNCLDDNRLLTLRSNRNRATNVLGLLVVTTKASLDMWSELIRGYHHLRLLTYTDALSQRRKMGSQRIRNFDVILTTFDVLKAKELALPEEEFGGNFQDTSDELSSDSSEKDWIARRPGNLKMVDISFIHLMHFRDMIIDSCEPGTVLRSNTQRGKAIQRVSAVSKICLLQSEGSNDIYSLQAVRYSKELMMLSGPTASKLLDATI